MKVLKRILSHGLRRRCPKCGIGPVFARWHEVAETCSHCNLDLQEREGDCWAFMYITTAFITGLFFIAMLLYRPANLMLGRIVVSGAGSSPWPSPSPTARASPWPSSMN
jgi:uncharacterized protein (DUF983 family)